LLQGGTTAAPPDHVDSHGHVNPESAGTRALAAQVAAEGVDTRDAGGRVLAGAGKSAGEQEADAAGKQLQPAAFYIYTEEEGYESDDVDMS
jgi:sirohydrochlorin ferrochelatase